MARDALVLVVYCTTVLSGACTPEVRDQQFRCDPLLPDPCPPGLVCRQMGYDFSCVSTGEFDCGNNELEPGEQCDGTDFGGAGCGDFGLDDGQLICQTDCTVFCTACGNGRLEISPEGIGEQCDDQGLQSHDGCASDCTLELPMWQRWQHPLERGRWGHTMAYDERDGHAVLFGGESELGLHDDTWKLVEGNWNRIETHHAPDPRTFHEMVYDSGRQRVVLFGGVNDESIRGDTWTFDGADWQRLWTTGSPSPRYDAAMTYDAHHDQVLLFGGTSWGLHGDTWTLDGEEWTQLDPVEAPSARWGASLIYDPIRRQALLFGGFDGTGFLDDLWAWDGQQWSRVYTDVRPSARALAQMTYDPLLERGVLFGGQYFGQGLKDTWTFDGQAWQLFSPQIRPMGRFNGVAAFDAHTEGVVVHGGVGRQVEPFSDVWAFDGAEWHELAAAASPKVEWLSFATATDPSRQQLMLFGAADKDEDEDEDEDAQANELWMFDGFTWTRLPQELSPTPRQGSAMVFDTERDRLVLFGGFADASPLQETWEHDGEVWTLREGLLGPPARSFHAMTWDPVGRVVVIHGGHLGPPEDLQQTNFLGDTWIYDGVSWQELPEAGGPMAAAHRLTYNNTSGRVSMVTGYSDRLPIYFWELEDGRWVGRDFGYTDQPQWRFLPLLVSDPFRGTLLLYGGFNLSGYVTDLWEFDGTGWHEHLLLSGPENHMPPAGAFTPWQRGLTLLSQGETRESIDETWIFSWRSNLPDERCTNDRDDDGDRLVDCEDPDCAWHSACHD